MIVIYDQGYNGYCLFKYLSQFLVLDHTDISSNLNDSDIANLAQTHNGIKKAKSKQRVI